MSVWELGLRDCRVLNKSESDEVLEIMLDSTELKLLLSNYLQDTLTTVQLDNYLQALKHMILSELEVKSHE